MREHGHGIGLSIGGLLGSQAAEDTAAYAAMIASHGGSISGGEQANLAAFASALYALAGRVDFWPLRSSQNMGTGTTAYSFHGANGTLTNSPAWHANGLVLSGAAHLSVPQLSPGSSARTYFAIANINNPGPGGWSPLIAFGPQNVGEYSELATIEQSGDPDLRHHIWGGHTIASTAPAAGDYGAFRGWGLTYETLPRSRLFLNGTQIAENTTAMTTGAGGDHAFGRTADGRNMAGTLAFVLTQLAALDVSAIYAAYKLTIGQGLSLP